MHTELAGTVSISSAVTSQVIQCIPSVLPWLAGVGANWGRWRWLSLRYTYIPATATTTLGTIALGMIYDSQDAVPTSLAQMSALSGFSSGAVWSGSDGSVLLQTARKVPCPPGAICADLNIRERQKEWRYITSGTLTTLGVSSAEANIYVPARLYVGTVGGTGAAATAVGNLYVTYDVELIDPVSSASNV